ncbi:hypothetical protein KCM76_23955 [Zooshikella marina]|uniref:hypothetical protein n=1 Tax=Zooshikella ganghwensis TaxID=202772 RepID=UPI001BAF6B27|nr:hypothetical protein [Zooshikella ganghwensis]MBU2709071.1 hypothetical protein [Zooshikella ganghwensis]
MNFLAGTIVDCERNEALELDEEIEKIAQEIGWDNVLKEAYLTLASYKVMGLWYAAASIIGWAAEDGLKMPIPEKEIIARMYWCLAKYENLGMTGVADGENLVWSTTCSLAKISYTSDWQPMEDPEIQKMVESFG